MTAVRLRWLAERTDLGCLAFPVPRKGTAMLSILFAAVLAAVPSGEAAYADLPPEARERCVAYWRQKVAAAEKEAESAGKVAESAEDAAKKGRPVQRKAKAERAKGLRDAHRSKVAELELVRLNRPPVMPEIERTVGSVGRLDGVTCRQKIDRETLLVEVHYLSYEVAGSPPSQYLRTVPKSYPAAIRSAAAAEGAIDGKGLKTPGLWHVTKSETFPTVDGGSATLAVMEPFKWPEPKGK